MASPFCEGRFYAFTPIPFILEFANTLSSVALLFPAMMPLHARASICLHISRAAFLLCGIGSVWYHATMSQQGKLFDELPMIFIAAFNVLSLSISVLSQAWKGWLCTLATVYLFLTAWIDATQIDATQNAFRTLFTLPFVVMLIMHGYMYAKDKVEDHIRPLYRGVLAFGGVGCVSWLVDLHMCSSTIATFRLHGIWHICVSITGYLLICIHAKIEKTSEIHYMYGIPIIAPASTLDASLMESGGDAFC